MVPKFEFDVSMWKTQNLGGGGSEIVNTYPRIPEIDMAVFRLVIIQSQFSHKIIILDALIVEILWHMIFSKLLLHNPTEKLLE